MKNENDEEKVKKWHGISKTQENCVSDYMGKIIAACDSVVVLLAEL